MRRYEYVGSAIFLVVIAILLGLLGKFGFIDFGQGLQILITAVLVNVTAFYAIRTAEIAKATEKQAKASVKMAEGMAKPAVFPNFDPSEFQFRGTSAKAVVKFYNVGTGSALGVELKFCYSSPGVVRQAWKEGTEKYGIMADVQGAKWAILEPAHYRPCEADLRNMGTAFAIYSDIYGRRILSGCGYQCKEDDKGKAIWQQTEIIHPLSERKVCKND